MSRIYKRIYDKIYNEDIKEQYLSTLPEASAKSIRYAFYKSYIVEDTLNKDLFNFTSDEIRQVLESANAKSESSVRSLLSYISGYISWAIDKGYVNTSIKPDISITSDEMIGFVDTTRKLYYSKTEIDDILEHTANAQDRIVLHLPFYEGFDIEDLMELHYNDVGWTTGLVKLRKREGQPVIQVDNKSLAMIQSAYSEQTYIAANGMDKREIETPLVKTDYIIKNTDTKRTKAIHGVLSGTIYGRLALLKRVFDLQHFVLKDILKSGMIYEGYSLYMERGKLGNEEIEEIAKKFNIKKVKVNDYEYHDVGKLMKFINRKNILELYNVDIGE